MPHDRYWGRLVSALHEPPAPGGPSSAETQEVRLGPALDRLAAVESRYRSLIEGLPVVSFLAAWDGGRRIHYVSPQVEALLGFDQGDWLEGGGLWSERLHPDDRARALEEVGGAFCGGRALRTEYRLLAQGGHAVWVREESGAPLSAGEDRHLTHGVLLDVTERRAVEVALARERVRADEYRARLDAVGAAGSTAACGDPVTGLLTRPAMEERLSRAVEGAREAGEEVVLLCVDLDAFKLVNDSLGLDAGDELLRAVAARLGELLGPDDALGRPGSDDFLLMLGRLENGAGAAASEGVARGIAEVLGPPVEVGGSELGVTAAVGASVFPGDAREPEALLKHADAAMQAARELGPGEFAVYTGGTIEARMQLTETARLRRAISAGELVVHYQPVFGLPNGELSHLEALVRWEHPDRGLVPPLEFIPLAEESGLIDAVGRWVLDTVLDQMSAWIAEGRGPRVSVNVSPRQLRRSDFARWVAAALDRRSLDPGRLCLEITESSAMRDSHAVEPLLVELREAGVSLAVDDFGMGYSSLDRLRELPFSILKIDRSFLARAPADRGCAGIVTAALELADALGMEAVAEGVETEEQRRFLEERRCPLAQGFLLSRPLPAGEAAALLEAPGTAAGKASPSTAL